MALYPRIQILTRTLCGAETWKLWKIEPIYLGSFELCYLRWVEKISWTDHLKYEVLHKVTKERSIIHTIKRSEANWIGHILRRNWLLKYVFEGKIEARIEAMGSRGRRRKQLLDDLKERRRYWNLREEALDGSVWSSGFGRGYGSVVRLQNVMRKLMQIIYSSDTAFIYTLCTRLYYNWHIITTGFGL